MVWFPVFRFRGTGMVNYPPEPRGSVPHGVGGAGGGLFDLLRCSFAGVIRKRWEGASRSVDKGLLGEGGGRFHEVPRLKGESMLGLI